MTRQAIVIIDPQNDFTSTDGEYAKRHTGITQIKTAKKNINTLLERWSKEDIIVVQSDYQPHQFGQGLSICIRGTPGHNLDKNLTLPESLTYIVKSQHSAFSSQDFKTYLRHKKIENLLLCGFLAEYCVKQTALDALRLGFKVYLLGDCIGTGDDVKYRKEQMIEELRQKGAEVMNSESYKPS